MPSSPGEQSSSAAAEGLRTAVDPLAVSVELPADMRPPLREDAAGEPGVDPDPRLTFANERTYLAWNRTALALIAGGLAVAQFVKAGFAGAQLIVALPLIALGASLSYGSYRHWQRSQRAMRLGQSLPAS